MVGHKRYHRAGAPLSRRCHLNLAAGAPQPVEQTAELHRIGVGQFGADVFFDRRRVGVPHFLRTRARFGDLDEQAALAELHRRRDASPSSTRRSISREVEYCGSSICFSSSTGRISPDGARDSSSSASYQASGGKPALFKSCSTAVEHPALHPHQADPCGGRLGRWFAFHGLVQTCRRSVRTKCSCINLDYFMQMHLVIPQRFQATWVRFAQRKRFKMRF